MKPVLENENYFYPSFTRSPGNFLASRFLKWTKGQRKNYLAWVGGSIMAQAGIFLPVTMMLLLFNQASFLLIALALAILTLVIIIDLAVASTKIIIPAFFLAILADVTLVVLSIIY